MRTRRDFLCSQLLLSLSLLHAGIAAGAVSQPIEPAQTLALLEKAADWQLAHLEPVDTLKVMREETRNPRSWQQVSDRPEQVAQSDTQFYGVGALLLAGSAMLDLYEEQLKRRAYAARGPPVACD